MDTIDAYERGSEVTASGLTANGGRMARALDRLLTGAQEIKGDAVGAGNMAATVHTLQRLLEQVGQRV